MEENNWILQRAIVLGLLTEKQLQTVDAEWDIASEKPSEAQAKLMLERIVAHGQLRSGTVDALRREWSWSAALEPSSSPNLGQEKWGSEASTQRFWLPPKSLHLESGQPLTAVSLELGDWKPPVPQVQAYPVPGWDRYEPMAFLGAGGMGAVFKAFDPRLRRTVALKFLYNMRRKPEEITTADDTRLFMREAWTQARVDHANVAKVYEIGEVQGLPFLAIQFIEELSFDEVQKLTLREKVTLVEGVAQGLHAVHRLGVIHRDIKPSNILVTCGEDGAIRGVLTDFGVALDQEDLTLHGVIAGTPAYMSPEQASCGLLDTRSDVYSLGATLFEFLSGCLPIPSDSSLLSRIQTEVPKPLRELDPGIPSALEAIVARCLEKDPAHRYDSALALAKDLRRFLEGRPVHAIAATLRYRLGCWVDRNRALACVAGLLVLSLAAGSALLTWSWARARAQAQYAVAFSREAQGLESELAAIRFMPPHLMAPQTAQVRLRLSTLEARIDQAGRLAQGPGHAALGRAFLALDDFEKARLHFERALRTGYRNSEASLGMGLALATLYRERVDALRMVPGELRLEGKKDLRRQFGEPALRLLQVNQEASGDRDLIEGQILLQDDKSQSAYGKAQGILARMPWHMGAKRLQCEALVQYCESSTTHSADALVAAQKAAQAIAEGREMARSDPFFLLCEARLMRARIKSRASVPLDLAKAYREVFEALQQARALDPELEIAASLEAETCASWAHDANNSSQDVEEPFRKGVAACQRAISMNPALDWPHFFLIHLNAVKAWSCMGSGQDPSAFADATLEHLREYGRRSPGPIALSMEYWAAMALQFQGQFLLAQGKDARPTLDQALAALERARTVNPWSGSLELRATLQTVRGLCEPEPTPWRERAQVDLEALRAREPKNVSFMSNLAYFYLLRAAWEMEYRDQDPLPRLEGVRHLLDELSRLEPSFEEQTRALRALALTIRLPWDLGRGVGVPSVVTQMEALLRRMPKEERMEFLRDEHLSLARHALWSGTTPLAELKMAESTVRIKGPALAYEALGVMGEIHLLRAEWLQGCAQPFIQEWDLAFQALGKVHREANWDLKRAATLDLIRLHLLRVREKGPESRNSLKAARELIREGRSLWPQLSRLELFEGALQLQEAKLTQAPEGLAQGLETLRRAVDHNPSLRCEARWYARTLATQTLEVTPLVPVP